MFEVLRRIDQKLLRTSYWMRSVLNELPRVPFSFVESTHPPEPVTKIYGRSTETGTGRQRYYPVHEKAILRSKIVFPDPPIAS